MPKNNEVYLSKMSVCPCGNETFKFVGDHFDTDCSACGRPHSRSIHLAIDYKRCGFCGDRTPSFAESGAACWFCQRGLERPEGELDVLG